MRECVHHLSSRKSTNQKSVVIGHSGVPVSTKETVSTIISNKQHTHTHTASLDEAKYNTIQYNTIHPQNTYITLT